MKRVHPGLARLGCTPVKSPLDTAHFLFRLGFIVARAENNNDGDEHSFFADMPDFLSGRTNQEFNVIWEIHPCYREADESRKLSAAAQLHR
jgi:hypothetical protein